MTRNLPLRSLVLALTVMIAGAVSWLQPLGADAAPNPAPTIIPALQEWTGAEGAFTLRSTSRIVVTPASLEVGKQFATDLEAVTGAKLPVVTGTAVDGDLSLVLDPTATHATGGERFAEEGYTVVASSSSVVVRAPSTTGLFYGTRTLLQGFMQTPARARFPAGTTSDWPSYESRGFSLDVGRRFFTPGFIRDYIRMMSWYKLNEFQIHLNDNQIPRPATGWQNGYSGFRLKSDNPLYAPLASDDGAYDRADWDSFEDVAAAHGVQLVPEIDVPAHSLSFIQWKPELGLNGGDSDHLDLSKPETTEVIKDVFDEFVPWFRGPEVHFGADEYPKAQADDYRNFFNTMAAHVRSLGKHPRAWGSMKWMHGTAAGYDRDVTLNVWSNDWYEMPAAVADGYNFINTLDRNLYVVPFASYYHGQGLDNKGLYENWLPNRIWNTDTVAAGAPQGGMFAVWNDLVDRPYTELQVDPLVRDSFPVIAQKTWKAATPTLSYADFSAVRDRVGRGPGLQVIDTPSAPAPGDLTPGSTATATSSAAGHPASALVDRLKFTRWTSTDPAAAFTVDLGATKTVARVAVEWSLPLPTNYDVEVSTDGVTWRTVASDVAAGSDAVFDPTSARHVRVTPASAAASVGAWGVQVMAPPPLTTGATATASGVESAAMGPANVVDGNLATRWSANYVTNPWIQVDLGSVKSFDALDLYWEAASATAYRVEVSNDGTTWTTVREVTGKPTGARTDNLVFDPPVSGRYVKVTVIAKAMSQYLSLYELIIPFPSAAPSVDPTPGATVTVTATATATATVSATVTATATASATVTATATASATVTATATATATVTVAPPATAVDVYTTAGFHHVNGRFWYTRCEPYGQTVRCWTDVWSTTVVRVDGAYVLDTGWHFNTLTYLPYLTKQEWGTNPLANTGTWVDATGRHWVTECGTPLSGPNGCRTSIWAKVIVATPKPGGGYSYAEEMRWVVNNLVRFKVA